MASKIVENYQETNSRLDENSEVALPSKIPCQVMKQRVFVELE